ncbi:MAG: TonB family protein [Bryobacteraceae bacterium]
MTGLYDESSLFRPLPERRGPRLGPLAFSLAAHAAFFAFAIGDPRTSRPRPKSLFETVFKANAKKLIWYRFDVKLPEVSPQTKGAPDPPRTAAKNKEQTIVARPEKAPPAKQMTWLPAPRLEQKSELKAPNLLAFEVPQVKPPAEPAKPKLFLPPPERTAPAEELPAPPEVRADVRDARPPSEENLRLKGREFKPPGRKAAETRRELHLENAPDVRASIADQSGPDLPAVRVRPRAFEAPARRTVETAKLTLPPAPKVEGNDPAAALPIESARVRGKDFAPPPSASAGSRTELSVASAPAVDAPPLAVQTAFLPETGWTVRGRAFSPPASQRARSNADVAQLPGAPELPAGESNLSAAVISLTPSAQTAPVLPQGSKAGEFSASPSPSSKGGDGAQVLSARVSLPGLMIRDATGSPPASALPLAAIQAAPASRENLQVVARALAADRQDEIVETGPRGKSSATRVSAAPTPQFRGRPVYSLVIQAPNVTSHSGSWLMWFAERDAEVQGGLVAPVPKHKVDPVYTITAMEERIEGSVRLSAMIRKDGTVTYVSVLRGVDERLDRDAVAAFSKWEFEPAVRNGAPVELDAVVEIPFRLAPRETK